MFIRPAQPADALAVARMHVRSWQVAYAGLMPPAFLAQIDPQQRASGYEFGPPAEGRPRTVIALEDDRVLGFVTYGAARDADRSEYGEIVALYADPDHWHQGVGRALMTTGCQALVELGFAQAVLWVMDTNERALAFYRTDGWTFDDTRRTETLNPHQPEDQWVVIGELRLARAL